MKHVNDISLYKVTAPTPVTTPMLPPSWTPALKTANQTPLTSTRVRVSPSPRRGKKSSPLISVCTTSTPIQPLQGNKQKYVIVQGNSRHLTGISSCHNSFTAPTVEEGHQPIYLQGEKSYFGQVFVCLSLIFFSMLELVFRISFIEGPCLSKFLNHAD